MTFAVSVPVAKGQGFGLPHAARPSLLKGKNYSDTCRNDEEDFIQTIEIGVKSIETGERWGLSLNITISNGDL